MMVAAAGAGCSDASSDAAAGPPALRQAEQAISIVPRGLTCKEAGLGVRHLTLTRPVSGEYAIDPQNSLTFAYYDESNTVFYFTNSTLRMTGVMVSAGDRTMIWEMPDGADGWPSLQGPPDPVTGEAPRPDEVTFCFDYELYVQPSPYANYAQRTTWTVTKTSSVSELFLGPGESAAVDYTVTARPGPVVAAGQFLDGPVWVQNLSPYTVTVGKLRTLVAGANATVTCPQAGAFTMQPYETVECYFTMTVPDTQDRAVVGAATVSHELRVASREVIASFSAHNVGTKLFDRCAIITDDAAPYNDHFLGSVCREDGPQSFSFTALHGPYGCGKFTATTTASATGWDSNAVGIGRWRINGFVTCEPGGL
jgi:hypothetical protein